MTKKIKRKVKRFHRKNKRIIYSVLGIVIIIAIFFPISNFITGQSIKEPETKAKYEITEVDLFTIKDFKSKDVSVYGLMLGDNEKNILKKLGTPDIQSDFPPDIVNFEYSKAIDLEETGIIVHTRGGIVKRITFKEIFDKNLKGKTKVKYEKKEIYWMFGAPDEVTFTTFKVDSLKVIRILHYRDKNIEFIVRKNKVIGFSLILE